MNVTGNLGLTIWDNINDDFDYGQLEDNWIAVDLHDHTPTRGVQIPTAGLADSSVTGAKLAYGSVGSENLQTGSVISSTIGDRQVEGQHIAENAITPDLIESLSLTFEQIDPSVVPMGSTMLWWRPPGSGAVPGGVWEVMDGRPWNTITNGWDLTTGNIPDMRGSFALGTGLNSGVPIGSTGGNTEVNLAHSHNVDQHVHSLPNHNHSISENNGHTHTFAQGLITGYRMNTTSPNVAAVQNWPDGDKADTKYYSMYLRSFTDSYWQSAYFDNEDQIQKTSNMDILVTDNLTPNSPIDGPIPMDSAGSHDHGGATGYTVSSQTSPEGTVTDQQLGETNILNPYVGLCYIMKCRQY
jgi:hypothetical protein